MTEIITDYLQWTIQVSVQHQISLRAVDGKNARSTMKRTAAVVMQKRLKQRMLAQKLYTTTEHVNDIIRSNEQVLAELNSAGNITDAYIYGNNRIADDVGDGTLYYLYDRTGSVTRIATEWGRVQETYNYDPYGNLTYGIPDSVNFYGYNGESTNLWTGLQYLRARYYDMSNGNFLSEDTYAGQVASPLTLNRYTYVCNNPVNYVDPSGHRMTNQFSQMMLSGNGGNGNDSIQMPEDEIKEEKDDLIDGLCDFLDNQIGTEVSVTTNYSKEVLFGYLWPIRVEKGISHTSTITKKENAYRNIDIDVSDVLSSTVSSTLELGNVAITTSQGIGSSAISFSHKDENVTRKSALKIDVLRTNVSYEYAEETEHDDYTATNYTEYGVNVIWFALAVAAVVILAPVLALA